MGRTRTVMVLVPNCQGGIDRLFEQVESAWKERDEGYRLSIFRTHGRSMVGQSFLPFELVYKSSALFYMLIVLPFRLILFAAYCALRKIDVCHINLSTGGSTIRKVVFAALCRMFRVSYVIHLHGGSYRRYFAALKPRSRRIVQSFYRNADTVIVLGSLWKNFVVTEIGVDESKVVILPNAVEGPAEYQPSKRQHPPQIVFLGRLFRPKGSEELMAALSDERLRSKEWSAVLAGDGEVAEYRRRIRDLELEARIDVPGWLDSVAVTQLLARSTIFVLPSHVENLPLSMLEAMAFGLCPVVTPVGSIEDVIEDHVNGIVIPVQDSRALADALLGLLNDPEACRQMGERARRNFLQAHDVSDFQPKLENIYTGLLV